MQVTGAAIAPEKCWWYLIDFTWCGGKWKYKDRSDLISLSARDRTGAQQELSFSSYSTARKMVGVKLAPNGTEKAQLRDFQEKVDEWNLYLLDNSMDAKSAWQAFQTTISKSIEYPLVATCISEAQINRVMASLLKVALPKANYVRTFPRAVLFGPTSHQGLGVSHPYTYQMVRHIQDIVNQLWKTSASPSLLRANLEAMQLEAGTHYNVFSSQAMEIQWFNTTQSWIIETLHFCRKHEITLDIAFLELTAQCENDKFIMEELSRAGFSKQDMTRLNRCRIYHQVVTLSDISEGNGISLRSDMGDNSIATQSFRYQWPRQGVPTRQDLIFWQQSLKQVFCTDGNRLKQRLGSWYTVERQSSQWRWYLSSEGELFEYRKHQWWKYPSQPRRTRHRSFDNQPRSTTVVPHSTLRKTVIKKVGTVIYITGTRPQLTFEQVRRSPILMSLQHSETTRWCTDHWKLEGQLPLLASSLFKGIGLCISDGSYTRTDSMCTCGWIIYVSPQLYLEGGGRIPGCISDDSAYRGELGGMLAILTIIAILEEHFTPSLAYTLDMGCDNDSALDRTINSSRQYLNCTWKSYDLLTAMVKMKEPLKLQPNLITVAGHADELGRTLTLAETLNVRADEIAEIVANRCRREHSDRQNSLPSPLRGSTAVHIQGIWVGSAISKTLINQIHKQKILQWWIKKGRLTAATVNSVDWEVVGRVSSEASFLWRKFMAKWLTNTHATGINMKRRHHRLHSLCPLCLASEESLLHLLQCPSPTSNSAWEEGLTNLSQWMMREHTCPQLRRAILRILRLCKEHGWRGRWLLYDVSPPVERCMVDQVSIGWEQFLTGFFSKHWAALQQKYYSAKFPRKSGQRWAVRLSHQLWRLLFSLWENRNTILHETQIDRLSGESSLRWAIGQEYSKGVTRLPPIYHHYLQIPIRTTLKGPISALKQWLVLIRRARTQAGELYTDRIESSQALRRWIGL